MSSLYELTAELQQLRDLMEDCADMDLLSDTMEGVQGDFEDKITGYCMVIRDSESQIAGIKAEEVRLKQRRVTIENNIRKMKDWMFTCMKAADIPKVKNALFTVSIQKNGGKAPLITPAFPEDLPEEYRVAEWKPNSDLIREALENGKEIAGCSIGERGESLRIK